MSQYRRGKIWWYKFQWRGASIRESSGSTSRAVARKMETKHRERLEDEWRSGVVKRSFAELMVAFIEEHCAGIKESSRKRYNTSIKMLREHFGSLYIHQINRAVVQDYVAGRRKEATDATIRRDLACLSSALSHAVEKEWIEHNVMKSISLRSVKESKPRVRWLRPNEYVKVLDKAPAYLKPMIIILVETGMRLGELLALERKDVDLDRREIYLTKTKTDAPRTIPLSDIGWAQFRAQLQTPSIVTPLVFYTRKSTAYSVTFISVKLGEVFRKAGIKDFRAHDLRHTFASWYMQNGGRLERLQAILGHSRLEQTRKYAHLSTADLHDDLEKVGTKMGTDATESES